jgi:hypothetical protein
MVMNLGPGDRQPIGDVGEAQAAHALVMSSSVASALIRSRIVQPRSEASASALACPPGQGYLTGQ